VNGFDLPPRIPATRNPVTRYGGLVAMRLMRWRMGGAFPDLSRFVLIIAPHTSNWDFFVALAAKFALGLECVWIGKHSIFRWPVAGLLRRLGGIAVNRASAHGVVHQLVAEFGKRERMVFALAPEGTRKRVEHWRSGYWHVARAAHVPIVPVGLDYSLKTIFIGPPLTTSGSLENDERTLREFFAGMGPKVPANYRV
jgi:1-acyl-sn-glycerol-3-phosphate acyltransferase